jgi:hypothetical protein
MTDDGYLDWNIYGKKKMEERPSGLIPFYSIGDINPAMFQSYATVYMPRIIREFDVKFKEDEFHRTVISVKGVNFSFDEFDKYFNKHDFKVEDVFSLYNTEQRRVLIEGLGWDNLIDKLKPRVIDTQFDVSKIDGKPICNQLLEFDININGETEAVRYVKVEDHTTHKITCLGVPRIKDTDTCLKAVAFTFGLKPNDYKPLWES